MQRKMQTFLLAAAVATGTAFAHGGKSHRLLGTLQELQTSALVVETPDGRKATVQLDQATRYEKERKPAARSTSAPA